MRSDLDPARQPAYAAARNFVDVALRSDGSLFEPDRAAWSVPVLDDLYARFNLVPDESSGRFEDKFERQLAGAAPATIQLAAELLFVHFLIATDIGAPAKRRVVDLIRSWSPEPITIPAKLESAFSTGVCNTGVAFKTYRPNQLWFLIDFMRAWKRLDQSDRERLLADPWEFKEFTESVPQKAAYTQRQALLHLVFPSTFEDMVSRDHKALIIQAFAVDVAESLPADPDRAIAMIRSHLKPTYGSDFSFYDTSLVGRWRPSTPAPNVSPSSDASRHAWLIRGTANGKSLVPGWLSQGYCAIGWHELGELQIDIDRETLIARLKAAFPDYPEGTIRSSAGMIMRFLQVMRPGDVVMAPNGADLYVGIVDGAVEHQTGDDFPWRRPVEWANPAEPISRSDTSPGLYSKLRTLLTITDISENLAELEVYLKPTTSDQAAQIAEMLDELPIPAADRDLESRLHVPAAWLDEQIELLRRKRQLVFYGPPGTGKTFIAQELADHITGSGGTFVLVQFHPGYSYEDFFEGFRPRPTGTGTIGFELVPGPLRRLADAARADRQHPYVLVVDEINRGNVAKIFGELYFLLEYRDRSISLQYSGGDDLFQLPANLFIIGTMNTVDRSIALVDAAMRRRFYFTGLFPDRPPVSDVLPLWLRAHGLPREPALLLKALNERIAEPDSAIGPSYFMEDDIGDDRALRRVWEHSIIPQLEELYFGTGVSVAERFDLDVMKRVFSQVSDNTVGSEI